jgi:hypothetical protein
MTTSKRQFAETVSLRELNRLPYMAGYTTHLSFYQPNVLPAVPMGVPLKDVK